MARLGDVCSKATSGIAQKDLEGRFGEFPIYGASGFITTVDFYHQEKPYIAVVKDGAGVGRIMKLPAKSSVIGTMQYIIPNENVDIGYLAYAMENMNLAKYYTGATIPHIYFKDYQKEELSLPPLEEQRRIAALLDKVSDLIAKRRAQLDKLDLLDKARFVEMFGDPVNNEKNWPIVTLGNVAEIRIGPFGSLLHKEDYITGGHALVNPSHIIDGQIRVDENLTISDEKYDELPAYQLKVDDIVLGRRGEMGRCAVVHQKGLLCGTGSIIIRPNALMKPYFLQNIISNPAYKKIIEDRAVGVTMMNLNVPIVSELKVPLLPVHLQEQFIDFMDQVDKSKLTIQQSLDKLETLKKALMQQYFG